ncbi:MAG TPA: hypothetical protein VHW02_02180 [Rhizomicrobium sp.]|jgi:hypothetical protein|nr:hypothetical protein [Rhizomicrobium sp.]
MKIVLTVVGVLCVLIGALWIGQGSGYIAWPASSFMINQTQWGYYGIALALFGILLVYLARRKA